MSRILHSGFAISCALLLTPAHAQMERSPVNYTGMNHLARIVNSTPGMAGYIVGGVQDGVTLRTTGNVLVGGPSGMRIPVPVTAQATVSKAAMAKAAAKFVAKSTIIGAPFLAYDTYKFLRDEMLLPPCTNNAAMFCSPVTEQGGGLDYEYDYSNGLKGGKAKTRTLACAKLASTVTASQPAGSYWTAEPVGVNGYCEMTKKQTSNDAYITAYGTAPSTGTITCNGAVVAANFNCPTTPGEPGAPLTEEELITKVTGTNWDPLRSKKMHDALVADMARAPGTITNDDLKPGTSGLVWEGTPATSPPVVTKTETVPNADGTTSTKKTTETTTVTPVAPAPSTIGAPAVPEFKTATTATVTNTNNTTNVTTTESTSITNYAPAVPTPEAAKLEIPDDYARENTLKSIETELKLPEAKEMPDQDQLVKDAKKDGEDKLKALRDAIPGDMAGADKSGFFSWVWTAPIGSCVPTPAVSTSAGVIRWDICPTVNNIRDLMGWLFGLFGAIMIYNQIFRSND